MFPPDSTFVANDMFPLCNFGHQEDEEDASENDPVPGSFEAAVLENRTNDTVSILSSPLSIELTDC